MLDAFTDYPIPSYGDVAGEKAPIRRATILTYDRNKYCDVLVYQVDEDGDLLEYISENIFEKSELWWSTGYINEA